MSASYEFLDKMFGRLGQARHHYAHHKECGTKPFPSKKEANEYHAITNALHGTVIAIECSIKDYLKTHGENDVSK